MTQSCWLVCEKKNSLYIRKLPLLFRQYSHDHNFTYSSPGTNNACPLHNCFALAVSQLLLNWINTSTCQDEDFKCRNDELLRLCYFQNGNSYMENIYTFNQGVVVHLNQPINCMWPKDWDFIMQLIFILLLSVWGIVLTLTLYKAENDILLFIKINLYIILCILYNVFKRFLRATSLVYNNHQILIWKKYVFFIHISIFIELILLSAHIP